MGKRLGHHYLKDELDTASADGSIMIVAATDAPLSDRNLKRLAERAIIALGRTGSSMSNGSGDYAIAFSTHEGVRRTPDRRAGVTHYPEVGNDALSPIFQAVWESTEEAILNSLCTKAVKGHRGTIESVPVGRIKELMGR